MDFYNNYGRPYYQPTQMQQNIAFQPQVQPQPQIRTNKLFVTSLEDALNRYAEPNTVIVYRHQDEKLEFEVMTDAQGKKTYKTFVLGDYLAHKSDETVKPSSTPTEDIKRLEERIRALENEVLKKYKDDKRIEKKGGFE